MNAAAYVRVSSKAQDHSSQRAAIERTATARGDKIRAGYAEKKPAKTIAREELQRLRNDVRAGHVRKLYVFRLDRLARSGIRDTFEVVEELRAHGCELVTVADGFDLNGPAAEVVLAVMAWAAKMERIAINERISAARERLAREGRAWGRIRATESIMFSGRSACRCHHRTVYVKPGIGRAHAARLPTSFVRYSVGMGLADLLTSGAVAGISSVLSLVVTGLLFPRALEQWRERRSLAGTYKRYRDPIVLAARELAGRCAEIYDEFPTGYLDRELWTVADPFDVVNDATNIHFRKYKLTSTVYRLSAFLGWIELYRRDVAFLDAGKDGKNRRLDARLHDVQATLADGRWHEREERYEWRDSLLFREEQRAIGEAMIRSDAAGRTVIGYGAFCAGVEGSDPALVRAVRPALDFVADTVGHHDFRKVRFREVAFHLVALVEELDGNRLPDHLRHWRDNVLGWRDPDRRWLDRGDPEVADRKTSAEAA